MVNLKDKPFYLNDEQIKWVEDTIANMSEDEKIGQLFIVMNIAKDNEEEIKEVVEKYIHQARKCAIKNHDRKKMNDVVYGKINDLGRKGLKDD